MTEPAAAPPATPDNFSALIAHNMRQAEPAAEPAAPTQAKQAPQQPANDNAVADGELEDAFEPGDELPEPFDDEQQEEQATDPLDEELHGLKARAILDAIKGGTLPPELVSQLKGTAKINGQEVQVSFREALDGYQRNIDYTNGKKELKRQQREVSERMGAVRDLFDSWNSGEALVAGLKRLGKFDVFHQAAIAHAREAWQDMKLQRENPAAYEARMEARKEREEREKLQRQMRQQPTQQQPDRDTHEMATQLQGLITKAFETHGIKRSEFAHKQFSEAFQALHDDDSDLADVVDRAARATAEHLADLALRYRDSQQANPAQPANSNGKQPQKPNPSPIPPRAQGAPTTPARQATKRMTPDQMEAYLKRRRSGMR